MKIQNRAENLPHAFVGGAGRRIPPIPLGHGGTVSRCRRFEGGISGLLIMDEAFDVWETGKEPKYDYHLYFTQWAQEVSRNRVRSPGRRGREMTWSVAALACLGQEAGNGTEKVGWTWWNPAEWKSSARRITERGRGRPRPGRPQHPQGSGAATP